MKKRIIAISCVILAIAMSISFVSCSGKKYEETVVDSQVTESQDSEGNQDGITNADTDADTNEATDTTKKKKGFLSIFKKEEKTTQKHKQVEQSTKTVQGNTVEFAQEEKSTTKKKLETISTTIPGAKPDKNKETTAKKETTTKKQTTTKPTTTSPMTTTNPNAPIELPEFPLDDEYKLTASLAMYNLQEKYDREKYVVNCHEEDETYAYLTVYTLKDGLVYSKAKVNMKNGKTVEKFTDKSKANKEYVL